MSQPTLRQLHTILDDVYLSAYRRGVEDAAKTAESAKLSPKDNGSCANWKQFAAYNMGREQEAIIAAILDLPMATMGKKAKRPK